MGVSLSLLRKPDHPHERGERASAHRLTAASSGSSPRAWGAEGVSHPGHGRSGIIPTSVGSGRSGRRRPRRGPDHPHERGERTDPKALEKGDKGSSPRAWGAGLRPARPAPRTGIIPTSVGSGRAGRRWGGRSWDHPHERGERQAETPRPPVPVGSSPRAWGAASRARRPTSTSRIIPTSVGSGRPPLVGRLAAAGSSPRAWGAVPRDLRRLGSHGIIPTSVGSGSASSRDPPHRRDHPHERGERRGPGTVGCLAAGSSPRAWGAAVVLDGDVLDRRIIPTSVGSGTPASSSRGGRTDHPHERGERAAWGPSVREPSGSSPRAWGAEGRLGRRPAGVGIIPTSVGSGASTTGGPPASWDHPHERGERVQALRDLVAETGSSPRAWGAVYKLAC